MNPVSDLGITGFVIFWSITLFAAAIFFNRVYYLVKLLSLGRDAITFGNIFKKSVVALVRALVHFITQECQFKNIRRKDRAPIGHLFMAWGFLLFGTYYLIFIVIGYGFGISEQLEHNIVYTAYTWVMDFVAPFVMIGAAWGIIRRFFFTPSRIKDGRTPEAFLILISVLMHPITHIGKISAQIAAGAPPVGQAIPTPPISTFFSSFYTNAATIPTWFTFWFWAHWVAVLIVAALIAYTRYLHVPATLVNDAFRDPQKGKLGLIDIKDPKTFGVDRVDKFTSKQLLDTYACMSCGYCQDACPAANTDKPLNPRLIIRDIKANLFKNGPLIQKRQDTQQPLIHPTENYGNVSEEQIWECTTCWGCMEVCPAYIEHVPKIIDMRRHLVQMQSKFPEELLNFFENIEQRSNPWGMPPSDRAKWVADINAKPFEAGKTEYLFYVGCFGSFDSRAKQISLSIARVLDAAGVSWGILGKDEKCCGDSMRRLGNEFIFDKIARENVKFFADKGVKKIITECPHCFTTLKNDYAQYGATFEVFHHTEFINLLIKEEKIKLNNVDLGNVVFHDSCYLGRHNSIYNEPREAIASVTGKAPTEMDKNHQRGFCCGAGGGRMWMEEKVGKRINIERVEQALTKSPETIAVCCPYCMTMFEDGLKDKGIKNVKVLDLAEIIDKALK